MTELQDHNKSNVTSLISEPTMPVGDKKRKNNDRKPRIGQVDIWIDPDHNAEFEFDERNQKLKITVRKDGEAVSARFLTYTTYYERGKKHKYINQLRHDRSSEFTINQAEALAAYSQVWAVDTNQLTLFQRTANLSVCSMVSVDGSETIIPALALPFGATAGKFEPYAWRKFIEVLSTHDEYDQRCKYGLIVNSEFSEMQKFNERRKPIHGDFFLPENWRLIYATADKPGDSYVNRALKVTDNAATALLRGVAGIERNAKYFDPIVNEDSSEVFLLPLIERLPGPDS